MEREIIFSMFFIRMVEMKVSWIKNRYVENMFSIFFIVLLILWLYVNFECFCGLNYFFIERK